VIIDGVRFSGVTSPAMLILSSNYSISRAICFANSTSQEILASWYRRGWVRDIMRYVIDIKVILDFAQRIYGAGVRLSGMHPSDPSQTWSKLPQVYPREKPQAASSTVPQCRGQGHLSVVTQSCAHNAGMWMGGTALWRGVTPCRRHDARLHPPAPPEL
jgi:hypothetical protein